MFEICHLFYCEKWDSEMEGERKVAELVVSLNYMYL
ncbi:hypothetical protein SLEP1_g53127 [Rubroshorea leprosula]|uniref:Uncharacterized protein n=1 Tax=Rubroshorea leprosula TaxID=152421 RepID=A0AAV5M8G1_9ROSI|nr:hypothetical protein SLEP1_g53127 [Rubroshorea leprosula]